MRRAVEVRGETQRALRDTLVVMPERRRFLLSVLGMAMAKGGPGLNIRRRSDSGASQQTVAFDPRRSAVVVCDMWDKHWCRGATERVAEMAPRMNRLLNALRKSGVTIIHAPSDTMAFYAEAPQRKALTAVPKVKPELVRPVSGVPPLPIDDKSGGCDTGDSFHKAWTRQHPAIEIADADFITDNGEEVYSILRMKGIGRLLVMGVHTNMCILNRSFAIKQMTQWNVDCVLVRDMTDAMYDPKDRPFVGHARGTELVVEHIERWWCPTTTSQDLLKLV